MNRTTTQKPADGQVRAGGPAGAHLTGAGRLQLLRQQPHQLRGPFGASTGFANDSLHRPASLPGVTVTPHKNFDTPRPIYGLPQPGAGPQKQQGAGRDQANQNGDPNAAANQRAAEGARNAPPNAKGTNTEPGGEGHLFDHWLGVRKPDYINFSISTPIANGSSWNFSGSLDRNGTLYLSPIGVSLGPPSPKTSYSLTFNYLNGPRPSPEQLHNFLAGDGFTVAASYYGVAASGTWSPGNGGAWGVGIGVGL